MISALLSLPRTFDTLSSRERSERQLVGARRSALEDRARNELCCVRTSVTNTEYAGLNVWFGGLQLSVSVRRGVGSTYYIQKVLNLVLISPVFCHCWSVHIYTAANLHPPTPKPADLQTAEAEVSQ